MTTDDQESLHLDAESLRPGDPTYRPSSEWLAYCTAGVVHDPGGESGICMCGLDEREWPDHFQASDGTGREVRYLPRVRWLAGWSTRRG